LRGALDAGERAPADLKQRTLAMSDYIYILESHLSADQNRVVEDVQRAAGGANVNLFLTGGAMRDMLSGSRIRDLDFVVEGPALKLAKAISDKGGARTVSVDDLRKSAELVFPNGVTANVRGVVRSLR